LKEFEIISDDLANLKRLQQENEQLKRSLAAIQSSTLVDNATSNKSINPISSENVSEILEEVPQTQGQSSVLNPSNDETIVSDANTEIIKEGETNQVESLSSNPEQKDLVENENTKSEKTPEDLLSEFEKMLG